MNPNHLESTPSVTTAEGENQASEGHWETFQKNIPSFNPEEAARLRVEDAGGVFGPNRNDSKITVVDEGGQEKPAFVMTGNKVALPEGTYISAGDFKEYVDALFRNQSEGTRIARRESELGNNEDNQETESSLTPNDVANDIIREAKENAYSFELTPNGKIKGQDARTIEAKAPSRPEAVARTIAMFGREGLDVNNGEYLDIKYINEALQNYVFSTTVFVAEPIDKLPPEKVDIVDKKRRRHIGLLIGTIATSFLALAFKEPTATQAINSQTDGLKHAVEFDNFYKPDIDVSSAIENTDDQLAYHPDQVINKEQSLKETVAQEFKGVNIGDKCHLPSGVFVHESSDYANGGENHIGIIGTSYDLPADADYTIQSFSVLDPATHQVVADNVTWQEGQNLGKYLADLAEKTGYSKEELENNTKIHVGIGDSQAGWADYDDIINQMVNEKGGN